jgi:O-antigen/teichoic acid export membrane protein
LPTLAWTVFGEWTPRLLGFAITLFIARRLGPRDFGTFALVFAWVHLCWGAVDVGTSNYALRLLAEQPARRPAILGELLTLNLTLAALTGTLLAALSIILVTEVSIRSTFLVMLLFLFTFAAYPDWFLRGTGVLNTLAVANFAVAALWLSLTLGLGALPQPSGYALAWALSPLAGAVVFWSRYRGYVGELHQGIAPRKWLSHVKISGLFALSGGLANATIPAASTGLQVIGGSVVLGSYTVGLRIAAVIAGALLIGLQNFTPQLVRQRGHINQGQLVGLALVGGIVLFSTATILVPFVLIPLIGTAYRLGEPEILIGFAAIVPWSAKFPIEALLIADHADRARIAIQLVSLAIVGVAIGGALLLHSWPLVAVGYLVAEATGAGVGWILLRGGVSRLQVNGT